MLYSYTSLGLGSLAFTNSVGIDCMSFWKTVKWESPLYPLNHVEEFISSSGAESRADTQHDPHSGYSEIQPRLKFSQGCLFK